MSGRIALVDVGTSAAGQTGCLQDYNTNVGRGYRLSVGLLIQLNNTGAAYVAADQISPALDLLASAFTRYRIKRCKFIYAPQSTTNTVNRITFAYASDPLHPAICPITPAVTTPEGLEGLADSIVFAPWAGWELDVSKALPKDWLFIGTSLAQDIAVTDSSRFEYFGAIGGIITPSSSGAARFGTIYQEFEIEFKEFCPITIIRPAAFAGIPKEVIMEFLRTQKSLLAKGHTSERTRISTQVEESPRGPSLSCADGETTDISEKECGRARLRQSSLVPFSRTDTRANKEEFSEDVERHSATGGQSLEETEILCKALWPNLTLDEIKEIVSRYARIVPDKDDVHL